MYRPLLRTYWDDEALSQIPPTVQMASKQRAVDQSRSKIALVNVPHDSHVFSVIANNQADTSGAVDNAGFQLIRDVSRAICPDFDPQSDWSPTKGIHHYWTSTPE
jgi:beta-lactamase class A